MFNQYSLKEIEIKLYVNNQIMEALRNFPLFVKQAKHSWQQKELFNKYFDTESYTLTAAKVALRVRKDGEQFIQTLKAKGHSLGGLSERDELDWYINSSQLDLSVLDTQHWPKDLATLDRAALIPIFSTDFTRDYVLVEWQVTDHMAQIEVALDSGLVKAGNKQEAISELELELRGGSADAMLDFAIVLAKQFPLIPSDTSKAERGYRLVDPDNYQFTIKPQSTEAKLLERIHYHLAASQRLLESYLWRSSNAVLNQWFEQLRALKTVLSEVACEDLLNQLSVIIQDWRPIIENNQQDQMIEKIKQEINNTRWGVFSLSASRWLLNHR